MFRAGLVWLYDLLGKKLKVKPTQDFYDNIYVQEFPSHQNAIDIIPSWNHGFPDNSGVNAGPAKMFFDDRIVWAIKQFGDLAGKK